VKFGLTKLSIHSFLRLKVLHLWQHDLSEGSSINMGLLTRRKDELGKKMDATFQIPDLDDDNNAKDFLNKKNKTDQKK
jgi:hypothetical protein